MDTSGSGPEMWNLVDFFGSQKDKDSAGSHLLENPTT